MGARHSKKSKEPQLKRVLVTGFYDAGHRTLMDNLNAEIAKMKPSDPTSPEFKLEALFTDKLFMLEVFDIGGRSSVRPLLHYYIQDSLALVFVVNSVNRDGIKFTADELEAAMSHEGLRHTPLLLLANRTNLPDSATLEEVKKTMRLQQLRQPWAAFAVSEESSEGIAEAFYWLANAMASSTSADLETDESGAGPVVAVAESKKLRHLANGLVPRALRRLLFA